MYTSSASKAKNRSAKFGGISAIGIKQQVKEFEAEKNFVKKENGHMNITWQIKPQTTNSYFPDTYQSAVESSQCQQHEEIVQFLAERWNSTYDKLNKRQKNESGAVELYRDKCPERHPVYEAFDLDSWLCNRLQLATNTTRIS